MRVPTSTDVSFSFWYMLDSVMWDICFVLQILDKNQCGPFSTCLLYIFFEKTVSLHFYGIVFFSNKVLPLIRWVWILYPILLCLYILVIISFELQNFLSLLSYWFIFVSAWLISGVSSLNIPLVSIPLKVLLMPSLLSNLNLLSRL